MPLKYVPPSILDEIEIIKKSNKLNGKGSDAQAYRIMKNNSIVAREMKKMMKVSTFGILPIPPYKRKNKRK